MLANCKMFIKIKKSKILYLNNKLINATYAVILLNFNHKI